MMRVRVKICGITNVADARECVKAGADFLGFNFYRKSPRYLAPAKARRIAQTLPKRIAKVGVFVNEPEESVLQIARQVGLDYVQLHGEETPESVVRLSQALPVIKAMRVGNGFRVARLKEFESAEAFLLDGFDRRHYGGTGKKVSWAIARRANRNRRIFLAGGLNAENVAAAIAAVRPYAVDVCSGVEARPGTKDHTRVKALMKSVKTAERSTR
jgi:phosphoribosylanthranilate isomerase